VVSPGLKSKAEQVPLPVIKNLADSKAVSETAWLGGKLRNVNGLGDRSAYGLPDEKGVVVEAVPENSLLARAGMKPGDVIRVLNHRDIADVAELMDVFQEINWMGEGEVAFFRNQATHKLKVSFK
jgi:S1-C subfamily serine protease